MYAMRTEKSVAIARKYFAHAARLNENDMRSLYGIIQVHFANFIVVFHVLTEWSRSAAARSRTSTQTIL